MTKFLLTAAVLLIGTAAANAATITCGQPTVAPYDYDRNPVVSIEVDYQPQFHAWQIFHHRASGDVISRNAQYVVADRSDSHVLRWGGELYRNRSLYMVGKMWIDFGTGAARYEESLYDRSQGDRLDLHVIADCRLNGFAPPPVAVVPVPVAPVVVPVAPVAVAPAAPVQQNNNAPNNVVVAPPSSNNVTITIVPGTTYSPQPKVEVEKTEPKAEPKSGS
jgi:hypothetical protein